MKGVPATAVGASFALTAFAVAILAGLFAGNAADLILQRAILALLLCYPVGLFFGMVCRRIVEDHARSLADGITVQQSELGDVEILSEEDGEEVTPTS